jgi:hypothetical protein
MSSVFSPQGPTTYSDGTPISSDGRFPTTFAEFLKGHKTRKRYYGAGSKSEGSKSENKLGQPDSKPESGGGTSGDPSKTGGSLLGG